LLSRGVVLRQLWTQRGLKCLGVTAVTAVLLPEYNFTAGNVVLLQECNFTTILLLKMPFYFRKLIFVSEIVILM
jgi:hypothetical protein